MDDLGQFVISELEKQGINCKAVVDPTRKTTQKNAVVCQGQRLLKIDTVDNQPISEAIIEKLVIAIKETNAEAVIFSDFRHGIFNSHSIPELTDAIPEGAYKVADSQVASRWGNILDFVGFDLITPNEREARFSLGDQDSGVRPLAAKVVDAAKCKMLILKLGERGIGVNHNDSAFFLDSFADNVIDPVGAGDALLAYSTLAMLATKNPVIASIIGLLAASCECEHDGNVPISIDDIRRKLDKIEKEANYDVP